MRSYIFTNTERRLLEDYLANVDVNKVEVSKIVDRIRKHTLLFEDIYLYLRIRKTMPTS
jgi:hypothetical protein